MLGRSSVVLAAVTCLTLTGGAGGRPAGAGVDDPGLSLQWGLDAIGAPAAWSVATGEGVTIAIVDSGVDLTHEDLADKIVADVSCIGSEGVVDRCTGSGQDDDGHGTHVAGIAAAETGNGRGVAGVAPGADLMAVKALAYSCLGSCGARGSASDVSAAIVWAADHGAKVINLSLGSLTDDVLGPSFADALQYAWGRGAIPVVAAGNDIVLSSGFSDEPAIVVAAVDRDGGKASYSNGVGSAQWSLVAPGGEGGDDRSTCSTGHTPLGVLSTYWAEDDSVAGYACLAGTSMAAPHVAGAAAVLLSAGLSPQQVVDRLLATADDLGVPGRDSTFGAGRVNLARAVEGLGSQPPGTTSTTAPAPTSSTAAPGGGPGPAATSTTAPSIGAPATPTSTADPSFGAPAPIDLGPAEQAGSPAGAATSDDLPAAWVALAVLAILVSASATGVVAFRGAGWARRTPTAR